MAESTMKLPLGTDAPVFTLPEVEEDRTYSLEDFADADALVVAFLCRHCPYVKHVQEEFAAISKEYQDQGVAFVGIASNDAEMYPDDGPESLAAQKREVGLSFPYLFDESQEVAKAYKAACTPDFYVFDGDRRLAYRGRMDETRPDQGDPDGRELRAALDAVLAGEAVSDDQHPSVGCSIKWKPGNEPDYWG
jgi:peroxiredoxin